MGVVVMLMCGFLQHVFFKYFVNFWMIGVYYLLLSFESSY